jgi:hypothetical protein
MGEIVRRCRSWIAATTTVLGIAVAGAVAPHESDANEMVVASRQNSHGYPPVKFTVLGSHVKGLYPGLVKDMTVTLYNPYDFDLNVRSLRGDVVSSSRRTCRTSTANLVAHSHKGPLPLIIPAHSRKKAGIIPIFMPGSASRNCQKTTFTVRLTGTATKASR